MEHYSYNSQTKNPHFLYKLRIVHQLQTNDYEAPHVFVAWCIENLESVHSFLSRIISSHEWVFYVISRVHEHNVRIWDTKKSHEIQSNCPKLTSWCTMSKKCAIGPYYYDSQIVTGSRYLSMLNNYFLRVLPNLVADILFEQYGTPFHYDRKVFQLLNENLPCASVGRIGPVNWPAR